MIVVIVAACIEAVCLLVVVALFLRFHAAQAAAWTSERSELLTRIQRPEMLPLQAAPQYVVPDPELDESALVGTIHFEEE